MIIDFIKIIIPAVLAFGTGVIMTPFLTSYLYHYKAWKKKPGKNGLDGEKAAIFNELHKEKEVGTPRMGGIIIWLSTTVVILSLWLLALIFPQNEILVKLGFLSRDQTWIPFAAMLFGALIGLVDDILEVTGTGKYMAGGLSFKKRITAVILLGLGCGIWFHTQLDVSSLGMPSVVGDIEIGWLIIPLFVIMMIAVYSSGVIDGIDGLAGGVFATIFTSYSIIAFYLDQINLAAFCASVTGAILAFLWFNIPPARFYMSETGTMALTVVLVIVAFMTDSLGGGYGVIVLPIIALPLVITSLSVIVQLLYKKTRGKKLFKVAPIHHHFEAIGWPSYKVVMRFWVISVVSAMLGIILGVAGI
ncbi:MAG: hypothetical protein ACLFNN_00585 [Candidatus Paceibacterota bacterium]